MIASHFINELRSLHGADLVKAWIDILTLFLATAGAILGFVKYTSEKRKDREAQAREKWREYLQDARRNVRFIDEFWPTKLSRPLDAVAYHQFITRLMWACEDAVLAFDSPDWKECINEQIEYHQRYYAEEKFERHFRTLHRKLQRHLLTYKHVPESYRPWPEVWWKRSVGR